MPAWAPQPLPSEVVVVPAGGDSIGPLGVMMKLSVPFNLSTSVESSSLDSRFKPIQLFKKVQLQSNLWDFPGSPIVKTLTSNAGGASLIPGQEVRTHVSSGQKYQNIK